MQIKSIAMMIAVGCAATMLTGCGVPQEDYDAKVAELNTAQKEIESLKGKKADLESLLNSEKSKVRRTNLDLSAASKRITALRTAEAEASSALADEKTKVVELESKLSSAQTVLATAKKQAAEATSALNSIEDEYNKLMIRFESLQKNMKALNASPRVATPKATPKVAPKAASAPSKEKTALDVLNEMSVQ